MGDLNRMLGQTNLSIGQLSTQSSELVVVRRESGLELLGYPWQLAGDIHGGFVLFGHNSHGRITSFRCHDVSSESMCLAKKSARMRRSFTSGKVLYSV
jgi:hypothetical protein